MSRIEQIEQAIGDLDAQEFRDLARWFHQLEQHRWDEALDQDSAAGRLDFLFEEPAEKPWPNES